MSRSADIILEQITVGPMDNFAYFIGDKQSRQVAIVDPAWEGARLLQSAKDSSLSVTAILLTHGHHDHVNCIEEIQNSLDIPVYLSEHEPGYYVPPCKNLKRTGPGEIITIGSIAIECIHSPGHSPGGQCFRCGNIMLTGDTLFINGCGRCDLPGGDARDMYHTLYQVLFALPDETMIYPGHAYGPSPHDTLGAQKKTNPYLMCSDEEGFLFNRMD